VIKVDRTVDSADILINAPASGRSSSSLPFVPSVALKNSVPPTLVKPAALSYPARFVGGCTGSSAVLSLFEIFAGDAPTGGKQ
jgi:hypothetical protein